MGLPSPQNRVIASRLRFSGVKLKVRRICDLTACPTTRITRHVHSALPLMAFAVLSGCGPSTDEKIAAAKLEWQELRDQERPAWTDCKYGPAPTMAEAQAEGERALAQWDIAAADAAEQMSPEQEIDARMNIAHETGISPSQVDLKGIYERRAEQAQATLERQEQEDEIIAADKAERTKSRTQEACNNAREISRQKINKYREMINLYIGKREN